MILACTCRSEYQDGKWGPHLRVHTPARASSPGMVKWRCGVCLNEKELPAGKERAKK